MASAQLPLDIPPRRPALGMADFLVAESNAEAVAWLDRWPDWPAAALTIWGPEGSGKTHLAQVWRERVAASGFPPPLEIAATALTQESGPAERLDGARHCVVEDADAAVPGDSAAERGLFHLYNHLAETGGAMLLTAREAPARWPVELDDLRSRLAAAPTGRLGPPDDALMAAVLVKLFADRQLRVGPQVIDWLLRHIGRSFAAARRAVATLDRAALDRRRNITVPLARDVLTWSSDDDSDD